MITVKVPATSANLGPGFDCLGIALKIYNTVEVSEDVSKLTIEVHPQDTGVEKNEENLIYKSMKRLYAEIGKKLPPVRIVEYNDIPPSRGLGSSAACIVSGLAAANVMAGGILGKDKILELASELEGHPDNAAAALSGGFVISMKTDHGIKHMSFPIGSNIRLMVMIPDFSLSTKLARGVLPPSVSHMDAAFNVGRSSFLTASLITGNTRDLKYAVEDKLHQPYRLRLIPGGEDMCSAAYKYGADAFFISGSGSTLMAIINDGNTVKKMDEYCSSLGRKWTIKEVEIDNHGVQIISK